MKPVILGQRTVNRSVSKLIGILGIGGIFLAMGVWLIQGGAVDTRGEVSVLYGWLSVLVFGLLSTKFFVRLILGEKTPVRLSPNGLVDKRYFKEEIPWSAFSRVSVWSHRGNSAIRLQLASEGTHQFEFTWSATITRWFNKSVGLDGRYMTSNDLDISFSELRNLMFTYVKEFQPSALEDGHTLSKSRH